MFNIFSRNETQVDEERIVASISYSIMSGEKAPIIDVQLQEYNDECVEALSTLLEVLGNEMCYVDTVNIIKDLLTKQGKQDLLIALFSKLETSVRNKIINSAKNRIKDEPCIKPSEMFR